MGCDHVGPQEMIVMVEERLRSEGREAVAGMKFRFAENHAGFVAAAITEIERQNGEWLVTRLERRQEPLPESELGLKELS